VSKYSIRQRLKFRRATKHHFKELTVQIMRSRARDYHTSPLPTARVWCSGVARSASRRRPCRSSAAWRCAATCCFFPPGPGPWASRSRDRGQHEGTNWQGVLEEVSRSSPILLYNHQSINQRSSTNATPSVITN